MLVYSRAEVNIEFIAFKTEQVRVIEATPEGKCKQRFN